MREKKRVYDNYGGYVDFVPEEAGIMTEGEEKRIRDVAKAALRKGPDRPAFYNATVLALLAEIERLRGDIRVASQAYSKKSEEAAAEIDRLRGENEDYRQELIETTTRAEAKYDTLTRALTVAKAALVELRKFSHFSVCRFVQTDGVKTCDCPKGIVDEALDALKEIAALDESGG